ncbi:MAG: hypothetical protein A2X12_03835 [Bacteroidetes bacterium GWE2_29_8]|nr:MAG: hypothetical protein A2X12_03835 [Bacteroidetes bacterium GWE2_29_8]
MFKKLLLALFILISTSVLVYSQSGTLKGKVIDKTTKEPIPFCGVVVEVGGKQFGSAQTDFDGNYVIKPIPPGKYDVKTTVIGYHPFQIQNVVISPDKITFLDMDMESSAVALTGVDVIEYKVQLIDKDQTQTGQTVTSEDLKRMPGRSVASIAMMVGGVSSSDGEMGSIRGSRESVTIIDGIRVRGSSSLPKSSIDQVSVITGGIPARYGDVTGGIVSITTRGPSREFAGGVEILTSALQDVFSKDKHWYNLIGFNAQGPFIMNKDKTSALFGYFFAGELSKTVNPNYFRKQTYRLKEDVRNEYMQNPLVPNAYGGYAYAGEFMTMDDLEKDYKKENSGGQGIDLAGKLDVRTSSTTNLTFGGQFSYNNGRSYSFGNSIMNYNNAPYYRNNEFKVYGRYTQRFVDKEGSILKNAFYSIQADYTQINSRSYDNELKDDLFKYGYIGNFKSYKTKSYEWGYDEVSKLTGWLLKNNYDSLIEFTPSDVNSEAAEYTNYIYREAAKNDYRYRSKEQIQADLGLINGEMPSGVYGLWSSFGTRYNSNSKSSATQFSVSANGSVDIKGHEISLGFQFEQRVDRSYSIAPAGLWTLMNDLANYHILELDFTNPSPVYIDGVFQDTINYERKFVADQQKFFDKNLREKLGLDVNGTDWIDIDNLDPEVFDIDMFSADELLNNGNNYVSYSGYDYKGDKLKNKPTLDEFYTAKDEYGNYKREIDATRPIYMAGYIQDKFTLKDIILNVGLRIDRFDANHKVLKDPYLLYEANTVSNVKDLGSHPANIGSDYVVYVDDMKSPTKITGYRNGSQWYNAQGAEVTDPSDKANGILGASGIQPYLVDPDNQTITSKAFKDYEPQITYMPRVSFSFPISDEALFFAHYDILTKRPTSGLGLDPFAYLFMETRGLAIIANPDLKPEKTIDYELGFQQKITNSSSLKISSYYKENRNMAQIIRVTEAYPSTYLTYGNIDFGTVKGFTINYDKRRVKNVSLNANYTLQFADGSGSSSGSQASLVSSGQPNLRVLNPLDDDQRHNFQLRFDLRWDEGKDYNGPVIGNTQILANTGLNVQFVAASGYPYSKASNIVPLVGGTVSSLLDGSINGARKPWTFSLNLKLDRDFVIKWGGNADGSKKRENYVNVYVTVSNILNIQNVRSVYRATGNSDDDGYLTAPEYQSQINSYVSPSAFIDQYTLYMDNPYRYGAPRIIRLGASISL